MIIRSYFIVYYIRKTDRQLVSPTYIARVEFLECESCEKCVLALPLLSSVNNQQNQRKYTVSKQ